MTDSRLELVYAQDRPDHREMLARAFDTFRAEGSASALFHDGTVSTPEGFVAELLRPGSLPFFIFWEGLPVGIIWLNTIEGRSARAHYAFFRRAWGRKVSRPIGRAIFHQLLEYRLDDGNPMFDVILGLTPNPLSWRQALECGAREVGTVPLGVYDIRHRRSVDAKLVAVTRESLAENENRESAR